MKDNQHPMEFSFHLPLFAYLNIFFSLQVTVHYQKQDLKKLFMFSENWHML